MSPDDASVTVWMRQLLAGEGDAAVQRLWERDSGQPVRLARNLLGDLPRRMADEEDVALSAFDSFYQGANGGRFPKLNDRYDLWRLLVTITARKVYKLNLHQKRHKRGAGLILDQAAMEREGNATVGMSLDQFLSKSPTPEFAAQAAEAYQRLLALLPNAETRSIAQWKMEGFSNKEIATNLGLRLCSVERRLSLIRTLWLPLTSSQTLS